MSKSVCIIGAGIGGLTAGAFLAKNGFTVTVLEKATTVGGSAGAYTRRNRTFPTGATIAFGLEEGGVLREILNELQISLPYHELHHPMDIILPSGKISIYKDSTLWEQELKQIDSKQQENILRFWKALETISKDVSVMVKNRIALPIKDWVDVQSLLRVGLDSPASCLRLARYAYWTVEDLMRKYHVENIEPLQQYLDAQLLDAVQTDRTKAALLPSSLALSIYRQGSFAIEKGFYSLAQALANKIEEFGGEVKLSTSVTQIDNLKELNQWEVHTKNSHHLFDIVMNNSGVSFGPGTSYQEKESFSWGAFRIDAVLNHAVLQNMNFSTLPFAYQIVPTRDQQKALNNTHGPIYVTIHESRDRSGNQVEGEVMMTVSVHTDISIWKGNTKEQYTFEKNQLSNNILDIVDTILPIKSNLETADAGTPLTYQKYIGKAEVGGFPLDVVTAIRKPKSFRTKHQNLFIVGEQVFPGPGTLSSALSGYYAARAIIR